MVKRVVYIFGKELNNWILTALLDAKWEKKVKRIILFPNLQHYFAEIPQIQSKL